MDQRTAIRFTDTNEGDEYGIAGGRYRILVDGAASDGAFAIIEMQVPPGGGPVPHRHPGFQETFSIIEGEVEMYSETGRFKASKGSTVHIPLNGPVHCFKNTGTAPATLICTVVPAGLDAMFREAGIALRHGEAAPPAAKPEPAQLERMQALAMKYGQEIFPPGFLDAAPAQG